MSDSEWFASWFNSKYYPILYQNRNDEEAESFITHILNRISLPAGSTALDLACGRGRHSRFLSHNGLHVTGIDLSPQSIADANNYGSDQLAFHVHDMRDPFTFGTFDLILNLFTSFGYFNSVEENRKVLQNISAALNPSGIFVMDFMNVHKVVSNLVPEEQKILDGVRFDIRRKHENDRIIKSIAIEDQGNSFGFTEQVQAFTIGQLEEMFSAAGFRIFEKWGDYSGNAWDLETSPRLILFATL